MKAGLEKEKAALLVLIGGLSKGEKVILAVESGQRESTESWSSVLRDLKARGLASPKLTIADGHLGIWSALQNVYPESEEQRCWPVALQGRASGWEGMVTYYSFPSEHWTHIRTTNVVESPFAAVRLRTGAAKRFKKVETATALIWKMLLVVQQNFRKLNAPHLLAEVYASSKPFVYLIHTTAPLENPVSINPMKHPAKGPEHRTLQLVEP